MHTNKLNLFNELTPAESAQISGGFAPTLPGLPAVGCIDDDILDKVKELELSHQAAIFLRNTKIVSGIPKI